MLSDRKESEGVGEPISDIDRLIAELESYVPEPRRGLPEPLFLLISRLTPLLSVDLLIRDAAGRTLLTWRHDASYGPGWHLPGGIVRYQESAAKRIQEVARLELGAQVDFEPTPLSIEESLRPDKRDRAHIVSMLYRCRLLGPPDASLRFDPEVPNPGHWQWHDSWPDNLIQEQRHYERYLRRAT
jgi:ADP-ribose pyrophosphatase YjhB (NUDIX family)